MKSLSLTSVGKRTGSESQIGLNERNESIHFPPDLQITETQKNGQLLEIKD